MTNSIPISGLNILTSITSSDYIPIVQSASITTYRASLTTLATWISESVESSSSLSTISSSYSLSSSWTDTSGNSNNLIYPNTSTSSYAISSSNSISSSWSNKSGVSISSSFASSSISSSFAINSNNSNNSISSSWSNKSGVSISSSFASSSISSSWSNKSGVSISSSFASSSISSSFSTTSSFAQSIDLPCSKLVTGYTYLPNGILMQWGTFSIPAPVYPNPPIITTAVFFPIVFPHALLNYNVTVDGAAAQMIGVSLTALGGMTISLGINDNPPRAGRWFVIGW